MTKKELHEEEEKIKSRIQQLKLYLRPGDTVFCVLKSVSRSGMYRHISLYISRKKVVLNISHMVAVVLGERRHRDNSVGIRGYGMDMGFALVYALGAALWPNGTPKPHGTRNGEPDSDGGYALKHNWI